MGRHVDVRNGCVNKPLYQPFTLCLSSANVYVRSAPPSLTCTLNPRFLDLGLFVRYTYYTVVRGD